MATARRSITVVPSLAALAAMPGPLLEKYALPLDRPLVYKFSTSDATTADDVTTVAGSGGGAGNWLELVYDDRGDDLVAGNATILIGGGRWRVLPVATLTANATLTLGTANARAGHTIEITRLDLTAYTYAIANGGPGAGTLVTFPVSAGAYFKASFNGTNWVKREAHALL